MEAMISREGGVVNVRGEERRGGEEGEDCDERIRRRRGQGEDKENTWRGYRRRRGGGKDDKRDLGGGKERRRR